MGMGPLLLECHGAIDNDHESKVRLKASGDGEERMVMVSQLLPLVTAVVFGK